MTDSLIEKLAIELSNCDAMAGANMDIEWDSGHYKNRARRIIQIMGDASASKDDVQGLNTSAPCVQNTPEIEHDRREISVVEAFEQSYRGRWWKAHHYQDHLQSFEDGVKWTTANKPVSGELEIARIALKKIARGQYKGRYYESYDSLKGVALAALQEMGVS